MQLDLRAIFVTEPSSAFSSEIWLNVPHHLCLICSGIFPPQISWGGGGGAHTLYCFPNSTKTTAASVRERARVRILVIRVLASLLIV